MSLFTIGRVCVKLAGRDAGQKCVVLSEAKEGRVLIDGATRRREVNLRHLEPLADTVSVKAGASTADVAKVLEVLGVVVSQTKAKKDIADRPRRVKKVKNGGKKTTVTEKPKKTAAKKVVEKKLTSNDASTKSTTKSESSTE